MGRETEIDHDSETPGNVGQDYRFHYDNGDGTEPCSVYYSDPGIVPCEARAGRLARVEIEYAPGSFWSLEYDYTPEGLTRAERWPAGPRGPRQTTYEYSSGRLLRVIAPEPTGDAIRYDYDETVGNAQDPTEVVSVAAEYPAGSTYFYQARDISRDAAGRLTRARLADNASGGFTSANYRWREDGRMASMTVQRNAYGLPVDVADRTYGYDADGMGESYSDKRAPRRFWYDGGNRLVCAANDPALASCPSFGDPAFVSSYAWDSGGNPVDKTTPEGSTGYYIYGNAVYDEYPPGSRFVWYDYAVAGGGAMGGPRTWDLEVTGRVDWNQRYYLYDGQDRLRTIHLTRPTSTPGSYQDHEITILYDHLSRPIYVANVNQATFRESRVEYFWDANGRPINRITTPDAGRYWEYVVDIHSHVDDLVIGTVRLDYTRTGPFERWLYDVRDPVGLPVSRYEHAVSGNSAPVWDGEWSPFGELLSSSGDAAMSPPWRFVGQLELAGSDASVWDGSVVEELRGPLYLNQWRVYDPRVGQYLSPDPSVVQYEHSRAVYSYQYADHAPTQRTDPDGRLPYSARQRCLDECDGRYEAAAAGCRRLRSVWKRGLCWAELAQELARCKNKCIHDHPEGPMGFPFVPVPFPQCLPFPVPFPVPTPAPAPGPLPVPAL